MDDELDRFKREVNLAQLAAARSYEIDRRRSSRASVVMRHPATGDKVVISRAASGQHWTYFSVGDARDCGTVVDFLRHRGCPTLGSVREELRRWWGEDRSFGPAVPFRDTAIAVPKDRRAVAAAFAAAFIVDSDPYLSSRGIRPETLRSDRFQGTFRRDRRGNILFPHADGEGLCGFESKNHRWTAFSTGGVKALWRSNATPADRRLVLTESAIDGLSYHQLAPDELACYASTAGTLSRHQRSILADAFRGLPPGGTWMRKHRRPTSSAWRSRSHGADRGEGLRRRVRGPGRDRRIMAAGLPIRVRKWRARRTVQRMIQRMLEGR